MRRVHSDGAMSDQSGGSRRGSQDMRNTAASPRHGDPPGEAGGTQAQPANRVEQVHVTKCAVCTIL